MKKSVKKKTATRARSTSHAVKRKTKTAFEIRSDRLKARRGVMEDTFGDKAWRDTDLDKLESWISVDDELSNRAWLATAKNQLIDQRVLAEHAGAASPAVYRWNDVFISTYKMNRDMGMSRAEAIDSARQNAFDEVSLTADESAQINTDPRLYKNT